MEFASETLVEAGKKDLTIAEIPINYYPRVGEPELDSFRDGWRHVRFIAATTPEKYTSVRVCYSPRPANCS